MRNSVKHGTRRGKYDLELTIQCEEEDERYKFTIYDSISTCQDELVNDIQNYLKKDLADEAGAIPSKGRGILEMKACAEILAGPNRFTLDDGSKSGLNCTMVKEENGSISCLAYELFIQKPKLLGIYGLDEKSPVFKNSYISHCASIESLANSAVHLGVI